MKVNVKEIELIDIIELTPNPNNTKIHTKKQIDVLVRSMKKVGFNDPIQVDETNVILAGHGRLKAAKKAGLVKVPCIRVLGLSESEKRAYTISHNQIGAMTGMDEQMLAIELDLLKQDDFELDLLGFDAKQMDELLGLDEQPEPPDPLGDASDSLPGVVQLSKTMNLDGDQWLKPYDIPILREDRLAEGEKEYTVWIGRNRTEDVGKPFFYLYGSDSTVGLDATRTTIGFYVDDIRFERVWNNLPEWTTKFYAAGVKTLVMPDYSIYYNEAIAVNIYNMYRSFYVARYWQEVGFNVIPNIHFHEDPAQLDYMLAPIPVGAPMVAWQIQTFSGGTDGDYAELTRSQMGLALEKLKPLKLLTYGGEPGLQLGREICERHGVEFVGILNRAAHMRADVAKHEETRAF